MRKAYETGAGILPSDSRSGDACSRGWARQSGYVDLAEGRLMSSSRVSGVEERSMEKGSIETSLRSLSRREA